MHASSKTSFDFLAVSALVLREDELLPERASAEIVRLLVLPRVFLLLEQAAERPAGGLRPQEPCFEFLFAEVSFLVVLDYFQDGDTSPSTPCVVFPTTTYAFDFATPGSEICGVSASARTKPAWFGR